MFKFLSILLFCSLASVQFCLEADDEQEWISFKEKYNKKYDTEHEENERKNTFLHNLKEIQEHNERFRKGLETYDTGLNEFSDMSAKQFQESMTVTLTDEKEQLKIKTKNITLRGPIPDYVNWVERGFNTSVRHQGHCGSCYAFGATAALEAQFYIKHKSYIKVSEQDAVDCSRFYGNLGCRGGWPSRVYNYAKDEGIGLNQHYPYKGREDICVRSGSVPYIRIENHYRVQINNETEMKKVLATIGPVTVAIDASNKSFYRYSSGVYYDEKCNSNRFSHIVLVVGYGTTENNEDYWIIKNSWGPYWGDNGYALMARNRNNHCGIATHAVYPILK